MWRAVLPVVVLAGAAARSETLPDTDPDLVRGTCEGTGRIMPDGVVRVRAYRLTPPPSGCCLVLPERDLPAVSVDGTTLAGTCGFGAEGRRLEGTIRLRWKAEWSGRVVPG